jgi:hypothetical protein
MADLPTALGQIDLKFRYVPRVISGLPDAEKILQWRQAEIDPDQHRHIYETVTEGPFGQSNAVQSGTPRLRWGPWSDVPTEE